MAKGKKPEVPAYMRRNLRSARAKLAIANKKAKAAEYARAVASNNFAKAVADISHWYMKHSDRRAS